MAVKPTPYNVAQRKRVAQAPMAPIEAPDEFAGSEALLGAQLGLQQAAVSPPGVSSSYQTGKSAPSMEEFQRDIKPYLDYTGFTPEAIDAYRNKRTDELDNVRKLLLEHSQPQLDLRPLAGLAEAYSEKPTVKYVQEPTQTADTIINRDQALAKMIQDQREGGIKEKSNLLERITSMFPSGVRVELKHSQPSTGGQLNPNSQMKLLENLSNKLDPSKVAAAYVKLKAVKESIGNFDPDDNTPIAGQGKFGIGKMERMIPFGPSYDKANQNWANITDAFAQVTHALYGSALTAQEGERAAMQYGVSPSSPANRVRGALNKVVNEFAQEIEHRKAGYPSVREYYDSQPGSIQSNQFYDLLPKPKAGAGKRVNSKDLFGE